MFFYLLFLTHTFLYAIGKTWFLKNHFLPFTMSVMCIISYSVFNEHWFFSLSQLSLRFCIGFTVTQALVCIPVKPIKWAQVDSNHRPRAYQARALTCWAMSPRHGAAAKLALSLAWYWSSHPVLCFWLALVSPMWLRLLLFGSFVCFLTSLLCLSGQGDRSFRFTCVMEMMGFEPMTPCLQGRCSPNWATPPCRLPIVLLLCSFAFTMNIWMNLVHNRLPLENSSSMRDFQVLAGFLSIPASRHASTTHSKLNNNIPKLLCFLMTPIWFRVGTRISRSP